MSVRLSVLALSMVAFVILLLGNPAEVDFNLFMVQIKLPMMYIMGMSAALGLGLALLFASIFLSDRKREKSLKALGKK